MIARLAAAALVACGCVPDLAALSSGTDAGRLPGHCSDGVRDDGESDVDCGADCGPCPLDAACVVHTDCGTRSCAGGACAQVSGPPFWLSAKPLIPRRNLAAAVGPDGLLWAIGGSTGDPLTPLATVEAYSPDDDRWLPRPALPAARSNLAATRARDGALYVAGGSDGQQDSALVYRFDVVGNGWSAAPRLGTSRQSFGLASNSEGLLAVGGLSGSTHVLGAELLATGGAVWRTTLGLPVLTTNLALVARGDDLFALGGITNDPPAPPAVSVYVRRSGEGWSAVAPMPVPRTYHGAAVGLDGTVYVAGGYNGSTYEPSVYAYRPALDRWLPVASLAIGRAGVTLATGADGRLYLLGGFIAPFAGGLGNVEIYGPVVTLTPSRGPAGASVMLDGRNFAADAVVDVSLALDGPALASGASDASGALTAPIAVPVAADASGTISLYVRDRRSLFPVIVRYHVE